jgi:hypothetical protein
MLENYRIRKDSAGLTSLNRTLTVSKTHGVPGFDFGQTVYDELVIRLACPSQVGIPCQL